MRDINKKRLNNLEIPKSHDHFLVYHFLFRDLRWAIGGYASGKLLDIGCGNKPYASLLGDHITHVGCDIVQSNENKVDIICPATDLNVDNSTFDTILCTQVIEHIEDSQKLLSECNRVLKIGGKIILTCPMYWPLHEEPYDFYRFTKYGLKHLLEKANFEIVCIKENGGKYSVLGLAILHTLPFLPKFAKYIVNSIFLFLDNKNHSTKSTSNYLLIASKKSDLV